MRLLFLLLILTTSFSVYAENVIVKFYATWCPPCKQIAPAVKSVSKKLDLELQEIDLDSKTGEAMAIRLGVDRIPTLVLIKNGTEVCRIVGLLEEQALLEKVKNCFKDVTPSPISDGSKNKSLVNTSKTQVGNRETTSPTAGSSN
jgi:thiol-disulfide isomerase/thioredoxin